MPQRAPRAAKEAAASKAGPATKARAPGAKVPAEGTKRRPVATKAKDRAAVSGPAAKPVATEGEARKAAKKKTAKKSDDAYRPPVKSPAREETAAPTAKQ